MKINKLVTSTCYSACSLIVIAFVSGCAGVQSPAGFNGPAKVESTQSAPSTPPDTSSVELKRMKALAGKWQSVTSMFGKENEIVFTEYKVSAGGSAVVETIFPGTPQEMISVYYDDDHGKLSMTHYCMLRNRPYFQLAKSTNDEIILDVTKVEGVTSKDTPSMGAIALKFKDADHFSSTCSSGGKSTEKHEPMTMQFTRVKG